MKKKITPVFLPTEDKSHIHKLKHGYLLYEEELLSKPSSCIPSVVGTPVHCYVTVSQDIEPIKEGDNIIEETGLGYMPPSIATKENMAVKEHIRRCRKVISSNNPKLTIPKKYDGYIGQELLPQIPQSLLKELVANPNGEWEVEYVNSRTRDSRDLEWNEDGLADEWRIKLNQDNTVNITSVEEKKKMHTTEEVEKLILQSHIARQNMKNVFNELPQWIDKNLK
jgi:hypothetical protein